MNKEFILNTKLTDTQIALFYLGQEGFLFKYKDTHILIDPYLSDYVDKNCCSKTIQWIRNYPAPIDAEELDFIDYILCTHTHYDHTDPYAATGLLSATSSQQIWTTSFVVSCFCTSCSMCSHATALASSVPCTLQSGLL